MKYEVSYVLPNGTKHVWGKIEKNEKGQYLASYGSPHKTAYGTLAAAVSSYNLNVLLQEGKIVGFSVSTID